MPNGMAVNTYDDPITLTGSVQPVSTEMKVENGMYISEKKIKVWCSTDIADLSRTNAGDLIEFSGERYQVMGDTAKWIPIDGWVEVTCIKVIDQ